MVEKTQSNFVPLILIFKKARQYEVFLPGFSQSATIATWEGKYDQQRAIDLTLKDSQGHEVAVVGQIADFQDNIRKLLCFSTFLLTFLFVW